MNILGGIAGGLNMATFMGETAMTTANNDMATATQISQLTQATQATAQVSRAQTLLQATQFIAKLWSTTLKDMMHNL